MTDANLHTTNLLLVLLSVVCFLQFLVLLGYGIVGYRAWQRVRSEVTEIGRRHVAPLAEQVSAVISDVRHATVRVNRKIDRVESMVDGAADHLEHAASVVGAAVWGRTWPVVAVARSVRAAIGAIRNSTSASASPRR